MPEIYIVIASAGEYEDAWESTLVSSFDLEKVEAYVVEAYATQTKRNADVEKYEAEYSVFCETADRVPYTSELDIPRWEAGLRNEQITPEMREERTRIQEQNRKIQEGNDERNRVYRDKCHAFSAAFFLALGYAEPDPFITHSYNARTTDIEYSINKIPCI